MVCARAGENSSAVGITAVGHRTAITSVNGVPDASGCGYSAGARMRCLHLLCGCAIALLASCSESSTAPGDGAANPDAPGADASDLGAPDGDPPDVAVDVVADVTPIPPYDAGPIPSCSVAAFFRPVATADSTIGALDVNAMVSLQGSYVIAARQATQRVVTTDAGMTRDAIALVTVDAQGSIVHSLQSVYESGGLQSDLSIPWLVPVPSGALVLFRESRSFPGAADWFTRLRAGRIDGTGTGAVTVPLIDSQSDPFVTTLPTGVPLVVSARVRAVGDAGVAIATPAAFRLTPEGLVEPPGPVDLATFVPVSAQSVMLRPSTEGAMLTWLDGTTFRALRFTREGLVDARGPRATVGLGAPQIDDLAVVGDAIVAAWGDVRGVNAIIQVAVIGLDGTLRYNQEVDRFPGRDRIADVVPSYGGAFVSWIRGDGADAMLRGVTVQPDGRVPRAPTDILRIANAEGRVVPLADGRVLSFSTHTRQDRQLGIGFGQVCIP